MDDFQTKLFYEFTEEGRRAKKKMILFKCLLLLILVSLFLISFFMKITWLMILSGILIVIYDIFDILTGLLHPLLPIILAIVLVVLINPWYIGLFWASAIWHILGLPWYVKDLITTLKEK